MVKRLELSEYQIRDEAYIEAYCEDPSGKQAALLKAGYKGKYVAQEAYRIHKRLQQRIDERLELRIKNAAKAGFSVLYKLATTAENEEIQERCALALINYSELTDLEQALKEFNHELKQQVRYNQKREKS